MLIGAFSTQCGCDNSSIRVKGWKESKLSFLGLKRAQISKLSVHDVQEILNLEEINSFFGSYLRSQNSLGTQKSSKLICWPIRALCSLKFWGFTQKLNAKLNFWDFFFWPIWALLTAKKLNLELQWVLRAKIWTNRGFLKMNGSPLKLNCMIRRPRVSPREIVYVVLKI